jgi:hypothetical protein
LCNCEGLWRSNHTASKALKFGPWALLPRPGFASTVIVNGAAV